MKLSTVVSNGGMNGILVEDGATSSSRKRGGATVENGHGCYGGEQSLQEACDNAGLPAHGGCSSGAQVVVTINEVADPTASIDGGMSAVVVNGGRPSQEACNSAGIPAPKGGSTMPNAAECPISTVHARVREVDRGAYEPMVVSLGPYHRRRTGGHGLQRMEKVKRLCRHELLTLTRSAVFDYLRVISKELQAKALSYYVDVDDELNYIEFPHMLLLDAAFLLVTIRALDPLKAVTGVVAHGPERSHGRWTDVAIVHDLLLLENQIPFIVIEEIYKFATAGRNDCKPISEITEDFVRNTICKHANSRSTSTPKQPDRPDGKVVHHLLHQCHMLFEPSKREHGGSILSAGDVGTGHMAKRRWHRATQYHKAGVGLTKKGFDGGKRHHRLLDVTYRGGALEIPVLHVYDNTCSMLRNLMALEQASTGIGNYVTAYCVFLSRLMCAADDVALLTKKGIVVHHLGSDEEVAALFADLCKGLVFDDDDDECNYLRGVCVAADERYQSRVRNWMTWLKHKHFRNPCLAMAALAAVLVVVCTVVQDRKKFYAAVPLVRHRLRCRRMSQQAKAVDTRRHRRRCRTSGTAA